MTVTAVLILFAATGEASWSGAFVRVNRTQGATALSGHNASDAVGSDDMALVSTLPGEFYRVWSDNAFAYVTGSTSAEPTGKLPVHLIRIADPTAPAIVGHVAGWSRAVSRGPCLYVPGSSLAVFDTTFAAAPGQVGQFIIPGSTWQLNDVALQGDVAYAAHGWYGLEVIDIRQPRSMTKLATVDLPGDSQRVSVAGKLAAVANGLAGVSLVDISEPAEAHRVVDFADPDLNATDVAILGQQLYIAGDGGESWLVPSGLPPRSDGLWVVDIADPGHPRELARVVYGKGQTSKVELDAAAGRVYLAMGQLGLKAFDVRRPADPRELSTWQPADPPIDVRMDGDRLYVVTVSDYGTVGVGELAILRRSGAAPDPPAPPLPRPLLSPLDIGYQLYVPVTVASSCR